MRNCFKCGFRESTSEKRCPKCSRPLFSATNVRIRGFLMVACGVFLTGVMGWLLVWTSDRAAAQTGSRFTGTREQLLTIYGLYGIILLFGVISFVAGMWQLILGSRSKIFVRSLVGLGVLVFGGACLSYWMLGK